MKVLCLTHYSDRPETETFIGLKKKGVDVEVMCPDSAPFYSYLKKSDVKVINFKLKSRIDIRAIRVIRKRIKERKTDLVHGFNNRAVSNGVLASIGLPVKIIAYRGTVGNVSFINPGSWMTYLSPKVDRVICVSKAVRNYFYSMRLLGIRFSPTKFVTIHKGHSLNWYQEQPADLSEYMIPKGAFVVGCVANFRPHKGIQVLVDAAKYLPPDVPIHFLFVGHMDAPELKRQIQNSPMRRNFHLAGYRPNAPAMMASCNVFVLPALRREGFPKVVIEAMAYSVTPVVTDVGGSPELIENKKSGMIVPPGDAPAIADAIMYLFRHPEERHEMGQNARERIRNSFRIEDTVANTIKVYQELLNE